MPRPRRLRSKGPSRSRVPKYTRSFELRAVLSPAKLYQATGRGKAVRELLAPVVAGFTEGSELREVAEANRLLASLERMFGAA